DDAARVARGKLLGNAAGGQLLLDDGVEGGAEADDGDIQAIALVAAAGGGKPGEWNFGELCHHRPQTNETRDDTRSRSTRHDALARRGVKQRRTPAPPAGPAQ